MRIENNERSGQKKLPVSTLAFPLLFYSWQVRRFIFFRVNRKRKHIFFKYIYWGVINFNRTLCMRFCCSLAALY